MTPAGATGAHAMTGKLDIQFSKDLTSEQRDVAEASVRGMIEGAAAAEAALSLRRAEKEKLRRIVTEPLEKLVLANPAAATALKDAKAARLHAEPLTIGDEPARAGSRLQGTGAMPFIMASHFEPPFHFAWQYHVPNGGAPHQSVSKVSGHMALNAMSGNIVDGVDTFVNAHCGVGCVFSVDHPANVILDADFDFRHKFIMDCTSISGFARVDGGVDAALMRGAEALMIGTLPVYHRRISGTEDANADVPYAAMHYPDRMSRQVDPGTYAFNLGIWAATDYSSGIGSAAAQSACQAVVREMVVVAV